MPKKTKKQKKGAIRRRNSGTDETASHTPSAPSQPEQTGISYSFPHTKNAPTIAPSQALPPDPSFAIIRREIIVTVVLALISIAGLLVIFYLS